MQHTSKSTPFSIFFFQPQQLGIVLDIIVSCVRIVLRIEHETSTILNGMNSDQTIQIVVIIEYK